MGFIEEKTEIINNVALFEVLKDLPKTKSTSSLESVNTKSKNLLPYLLDLFSTVCKEQENGKDRAKCEATRILTEILIQFFPQLIKILKDGIIEGIKAGLACGVDFNIPSPAPTIVVKAEKIDFTDMLKIDPNSDIGSMLYGTSSNEDFNWFLYDLIQTGGSSNWKNLVDVTYDQNTQNFEMKIDQSYVGKSFNQFLIDFINSIELLTLATLIPRILNILTGVLGANLPNINTSIEKLLALEKVNKLQDKFNSSDPCKEDYVYDDSYFKFTNEETYEMENIANQKKTGVVYLNLGCGLLPVTVNIPLLKGISDEIKNTPPSKIDVVITQSIDSINNDLTNNVPDSDKNVSKLSLNLKMLEQLPKVFTNIILEPKIVSLYKLSMKTVNDITFNVTDGFDYAIATRVFFEYVSRESLAALLEIIFRQLKKEILSLVAEIAAKIIKEREDRRIKQINNIVLGIVEGAIIAAPIPNTSKYI
jgi:hypothetical protein